VTAEVSNLSGRQPVVFEPDDTWLEESRLQVEDSLLDPDEAGRVNLVIHNPTSETRRLEAGCSIGVAMPCLDSDQSGGAVAGMAASEASSIQVRHVQPECGATVQARKTKLGRMLDIGEGQLAPEEVAQVRSCVLQAHDVFAVEKGELGSVAHSPLQVELDVASNVEAFATRHGIVPNDSPPRSHQVDPGPGVLLVRLLQLHATLRLNRWKIDVCACRRSGRLLNIRGCRQTIRHMQGLIK